MQQFPYPNQSNQNVQTNSGVTKLLSFFPEKYLYNLILNIDSSGPTKLPIKIFRSRINRIWILGIVRHIWRFILRRSCNTFEDGKPFILDSKVNEVDDTDDSFSDQNDAIRFSSFFLFSYSNCNWFHSIKREKWIIQLNWKWCLLQILKHFMFLSCIKTYKMF